MRRDEVLGLGWPDIDFKEGFVNITKVSQYTIETLFKIFRKLLF